MIERAFWEVRIPVEACSVCHSDVAASVDYMWNRSNGNEAGTPRRWSVARALSVVLGLIVAPLATMPAEAADSGKVLVILSSANQLELRAGKSYYTGYYLDELAIPLRKIVEAGFTPVFANPKGNAVSYDPVSNDKIFFGNDDAARAQAVKFLEDIPELKHPKTFAAIEKEGTADYVGVFVPGGHAPMQDLIQEKTLGDILVTFHANARPTAVICHGPTALLSTISDPVAFRKALVAGDFGTASKIAQGWPYAGYRLTVFSAAEEKAIEGQGNQLGGQVVFYAADALAQAGAHVDRLGLWQANVIEDRELVSGQQPFSSDALGQAFVEKLKAAPPR